MKYVHCLATFLMLVLVPVCGPHSAELLAPATPEAVQISPNGALVFVKQEVVIQRDTTGQAFCELLLPGDASDMHFAPAAPVWRTDSTSVPLANSGSMAKLGTEIEERIAMVEGRIAAIRTSMSLWENKPSSTTYQDLNQQIQNAQQTIPMLVQERKHLEQELKMLKERLEEIEKPAPLGQKITVWLDRNPTEKTIALEYSYVLDSCGWQAFYHFEALPGTSRDEDSIMAQLYADVWQFSGMDWEKAKISLVTQSSGAREPASLPRWTIEAREQASRERGSAESKVMMLAEPAPAVNAAQKISKNATVKIAEQSLYARYDLVVAGLREGHSRVRILFDKWKAPLTWLARPVRGNTGVWLMADCTLPEGQIWPAGKATYYVEGQNAGEGMFHPEGKEVKLFFGADPRVSLTVLNDTKRRGESGFIGKEKHWKWTWTYTLTNRHPKAVNVRIERPLPQIVNEQVRVKHENSPEATQDPKKHLLYWDVAIPANEQANIRHGLVITAPADMPISPVAP